MTDRSPAAPRPAKRRLTDVLLVLSLAGLPFLFFWRFITPNLADRVTFARGDFLGQYYPLRLFVARELSAGRWPLWDPYIYGGQPALADIQSAAFYPVNLAASLLLGSEHFSVTALEVQVILHFSLAALFTYLLVLRLTRDRFAATVSAVVYAFGGYMTSFPVRQMTMLGVGVWLPLILLCLDVAIDWFTTEKRGRLGWLLPWAGAALAFGISILGGHPQTTLYVTYMSLFFAHFRLRGLRVSGHVTGRVRLVGPFLLILVAGLGLAAVQLLPTLEFIRHSTRSELNYATVSWGLPVHEMMSLLYPGYLGNSPQYVGVLAMVLAAAGLVLGRQFRDRVFWGLAALVSLILSFGGNTFLFSFAYAFIPGFRSVRDQERVVFLFAFSLAVLAGYGAHALASLASGREDAAFRRFRTGLSRFTIAFCGLTALFLYGWTEGQGTSGADIFGGTLRHHVFAVLLLGAVLWWLASRPSGGRRLLWQGAAIGLIAFNLFTVNWEFHAHTLPEEGYFPETSTVRFLKEAIAGRSEPVRISSAGLLPGGSSAGAVYGLRDLTGNSPLHLDAFDRFSSQMGEWRFWQLMNVLYVLDERDIDSAGLKRVHQEGDLKVYEVTDPFPPAWVVHDVRAAESDETALARLNEDAFDLKQSAVVSSWPGHDLWQTALGMKQEGTALRTPQRLTAAPAAGSTARMVAWSPSRIEIQAEAVAPGLLVLSEIHYPGWEATVDGQAAPLLRTDMVLQAVALPAGSHRVEFRFAPRSFVLGAMISIASLVLVLAAGLVGAWSLRRA